MIAKEAQDEATNYVVITNLRNKMNNFILGSSDSLTTPSVLLTAYSALIHHHVRQG